MWKLCRLRGAAAPQDYMRVNAPCDDVRALPGRLAELGGAGVGILLKIETRCALLELPNIILAAMRGPSVGVMIALGDLAAD
jgi:pyruvate kinase